MKDLEEKEKLDTDAIYKTFEESALKFYDFLIRHDKIFIYVLSFLLPIIIMGSVFIYLDVFPFGDRQAFHIDFVNTYHPFIEELMYRLRTGSSLLWSFSSGGGLDYITKLATVMSSPFNFLAAIFPSAYLIEILTIFFLVKLGFASLFMTMYLEYAMHKRDLLLPAFSTSFALCAYTLGFYSNIQFFDVLAIMPLVLLGMHRFIREGKFALYIISLALSIIFNSLTAFHMCVFIGLFFFVVCILENLTPQDIARKLGLMAVFTAVGIGFSAFMLLPTWNTLQYTARSGQDFPTTFATHAPFATLIGNFMPFVRPSVLHGPPNLYSGMLSIVLLPMFLISKNIPLKNKFALLALLLLLVASTNINMLAFVWHGFTNPMGFSPRFPFVVSFLLIFIGYKSYVALKEDFGLRHLLSALAGLVLFFMIARQGEQGEIFLTWSVLLTLAYLTLFSIVWQVKKINATPVLRILKISLVLVFLVEISFTSFFAVRGQGVHARTVAPEYDNVIELLTLRSSHENDFFRTEFTRALRNEALLYSSAGNVNRISVFSSQLSGDLINFMMSVGFAGIWGLHQFQYFETSPLLDAFFGVRYLIEREGNPAPLGDNFLRQEIARIGDSVLLYNPHALPIAFMVNSALLNFEATVNAQLDIHNDFFRKASGIDADLFEIYRPRSASDTSIYNFDYTMPRDGDLFIFAPRSHGIAMHVDGQRINSLSRTWHHMGSAPFSSASFIARAGSFSEGSHIDLEVEFNSSGERAIDFGLLNDDAFMQAYENWSAQALEVTSFRDTRIQGHINVLDDGLLWTSIPNVCGNWRVYVNGERRDTQLVGDAMMVVLLETGTHDIEFRYVNSNFTVGTIISSASFIALALLILTPPRLRKKDEAVS